MSNEKPKCGVVVEKQIDTMDDQPCSRDATTMISVVNPDDMTQVLAVILLCDEHNQDYDNGKMLILRAENGERIAVQSPQSQEEENVT